MKLVGISGYAGEKQQHLNNAYVTAFQRAEYTPIILPSLIIGNREAYSDQIKAEYEHRAMNVAKKLDILVLSGGMDLNPATYNEYNYDSRGTDLMRDRTEAALAKAFIELKKPIIGICRGFQMLGNMFGLEYFQQSLDDTKELHNASSQDIEIRSEPVHDIYLYGPMYQFYKKLGLLKLDDNRIQVNSWHHQGFTFKRDCKPYKNDDELIKEINSYAFDKKEIRILASTDTTIEAFYHTTLPIYGFQWHPEEYGDKGFTIQFFLDRVKSDNQQITPQVEEAHV